ncbi:MAG: hypothetical protein IKN57_13360 [Parasporobacterium sp.]|nr:hypothetical protein [Parasporobacterium sp.]
MRYLFLSETDLYYRSHKEHSYTNLSGRSCLELLIEYETNQASPEKITIYKDPFFLLCYESTLRLRLPIINGEMKLFFDNYKDYYYLPEEDMCVLKSVAHSVAKEHRENAKNETCYMRYRGFFIPQFDAGTPSFRTDYKSKILYREYHPEDITPAFCEEIGPKVLKYLNN